MPRNAEGIKVVEAWASSAAGAQNREDVPLTLDRDGWDAEYSQVGGKLGPERTYFNEILHRISSLMAELNRLGPFLPWDERINYIHSAFVMGDDGNIYHSRESSGPATSDAINPTTPGQTKWRLY